MSASALVLLAALAQSPSGLLKDHPPVRDPSAKPPSAEELLRTLDNTPGLKERPKSFQIASELGRFYYAHGRYADAAEYLRQAQDKAGPLRKMYLARASPKAGMGQLKLPSACASAEGGSFEDLAARAEALAKKGDKAASACALGALEPLRAVSLQRANALFLNRQTPQALAEHDAVLQVWPDDPDALFARATLRMEMATDKAGLEKARQGFLHFLEMHPSDSRSPRARSWLSRVEKAMAVGSLTQLARRERAERVRAVHAGDSAAALPPVSKEVMEAIENTERTPELNAGLAKLLDEGEEHLARGRFEDALISYRGVVPFQPENGRAKAGMAWALVGLGKPTAERIWSVAVSSDPAAVERLGDTLNAKGNAAGAKSLWSRLAQSAPSYAERAGLTAKLK